MADWPVTQDYNRITISSHSEDSVGVELKAMGTGPPSSGVWPTASKAIYIPFIVRSQFTAVKMLVRNGAAVSGNVDVGIYDEEQNQLVHMGSTAQAGVGTNQTFDITDTLLQPGVYYMALAIDNTTATTSRYVPAGVQLVRAMGVLIQTGLTGPTLPNPAVFAAAGGVDVYVPVMGVTGRVLI